MTITDEQIIKAYGQEGLPSYRSYAKTSEVLGITRQAVERRVLRLQANGVDLPNVKRQRKLTTKLGAKAEG